MNVSGKSSEEKTNKSCFPSHLHHTWALTPTHHVCVHVCLSSFFQSPGLCLFNLDQLWFAYLLTSRYWQPWPPGSLKACRCARRHVNNEHTGSPAPLWAIVREAVDGFIFPLFSWFYRDFSSVKVMLRSCPFLLLTFVLRGVNGTENSTSGRNGREMKQLCSF